MTRDSQPPLSETDKREVCASHGWVGRKAFQRERHDLCEAPIDDLPAEGDEDLEHEHEDDDAIEDGELDDDSGASEAPRWSRAAARRQGIPSKKTLAVRRITQVELATGRAELRAIGADEPYARPKKRRDCQWCPVCQLVRDGKSDGVDAAAIRALGRRVSSQAPAASAAVPPADDPSSGTIASSPSSIALESLDQDAVARPRVDRFVCGHRAVEFVFRSRPCVFVACKHSLFLDVSETGSIILNFPHLEPGQMPAGQSCAADLADRGAMTLEDIAVVTNLTRERIRQIELKALLRRARPAAIAMGLSPDDAAALGARHNVGPGAYLAETGIEGAVPSDVATLLAGEGGGDDS